MSFLEEAVGRTWSLWELMEELELGDLITRHHSLLVLAMAHEGDEADLSLSLRMKIETDLNALDNHCRRLRLLVPLEYIKNARRILADRNAGMKNGLLGRHLNTLVAAIEIELRGRSVIAIRPEHTDYYTGKKFFDPDVYTKFPSASFDFSEAGKAFALSRYTACVFHLMRVLEIGINAVRQCLAIPDPIKAADRNWGVALRNVKNELDRRQSKLWQDARDKEVFEEIYVSLDAVRNPWRNATMHVENTYTEQDADHILVVVCGFMRALASRMDEKGFPLA
jgi:hypothetical protein